MSLKIQNKWFAVIIGFVLAVAVLGTACSKTTTGSTTTQTTPVTQSTTSSPVATTSKSTTSTPASSTTSTTTATSSTTTTTAAAVPLNGAGGTFIAPLATKWFSVYAGLTGVQVNYQAVGSGAGINQITAGTVDFGESDGIMT
ncbi:MAG TPA: hypothetical protein VEI27_01050, partial [Dehalococcoidales bacterium]|nr:hypothetical protein [Dehalococcoidales bacterium]